MTGDLTAEQLDDVKRIEQLIARFNWGVDRADAEGVAATFTPDGRFDSASGTVFRGPEGMRDMLADIATRPGASGFQHWVGNLLVDFTGTERATARSYFLGARQQDGCCAVTLLGHYDDHLVRTSAGWRFETRRFRRWDAAPEGAGSVGH